MVLVLNQEEKKHDNSKIECDSIFGKGYLYVTNTFFVLEATNKNLIYFEILHTQILSLKAINNKKIQIEWIENGSTQKFDFRVNDAFYTVKEIVEKFKYENNFPDILKSNIVTISDKGKEKIIEKRIFFCDKKIKKYKELLADANNKLSSLNNSDSDYKANSLQQSEIISETNKALTMWTEYRDNIPNVEINRHNNIPQIIPNHFCWFDCWYDEKTECYISFNFNFLKTYTFDLHESVINYKKQNVLPNICIIPEEYVEFVNGYPAISQKHVSKLFKQNIEKDDLPSVIIPSVTDEMLNEEMISKWHGVALTIDQVSELYPKIQVTLYYYLSMGSRIILTNNVRCRYSQKERVFLELREAFPKKHKPFLP